jgi:hypothetical protein
VIRVAQAAVLPRPGCHLPPAGKGRGPDLVSKEARAAAPGAGFASWRGYGGFSADIGPSLPAHGRDL